MGLNLFKKDTGKETTRDPRVGVAVISVSCCYPSLAQFEEKAKRIIEQAIAESGVDAQLRVLPVSSYANSIPKEVIPKLVADYNQGKISAPAILIDGQAAFYGVPKLEEMKTLLRQAAEARKTREETTHESAAK
jgi:hypothetical protein